MVDYITLTETYNSKGIKLYYPQLLGCEIDNNILTLTAPCQASSTNSLLRWSGTTETIQIHSFLFDDGTNKATGGTATTIDEQIAWIKDYVNRPDSESAWTLDGGEWSSESCILHRIHIQRDKDEPLIAECTVTVEVGTPA